MEAVAIILTIDTLDFLEYVGLDVLENYRKQGTRERGCEEKSASNESVLMCRFQNLLVSHSSSAGITAPISLCFSLDIVKSWIGEWVMRRG